MASAMARDKSSFSLTCSRLSQYLKEKKGGGGGGLGALDLDMAPPQPSPLRPAQNQANGGVFRPPTTMNLLAWLDSSPEETNPAKTAATEPCPASLTDLSLQKAGAMDVPAATVPSKQPNHSEVREEKGQQLTIFYDGKILVFDNFPSDKVTDLLQMADKDGPVGRAPATPGLPRPAQNNVCDLPIARRNSLHRFLEKRKGRMTANSPYQVAGPAAPPASKPAAGDKRWLGLGQRAVVVKQEI